MKLLHLDIETAPSKAFVFGLFGQDISIKNIDEAGYTLCWAAKWHGKRSMYFDSVHKSGMGGMIKGIYNLLDEADAVVHYNGKKFDIPVLNGEFVKMGLTPPAPYQQIDLYSVVRTNFKFVSNKLDWVCQELGLGNKVQHKGIELWKGCMAGDDKSWRDMERYNRQDVRLLPKLYERLLPWINKHPNWAHYIEDGDKPICRNCKSTRMKSKGIEKTTIIPYRRYKCLDCGRYSKGRLRVGPAPRGLTV